MSKTTALGAVAGAMLTLQIDYAKLAAWDRAEIAKILFAASLALLGYYGADRPASAPGDPVEKRETKGVEPGTDPLK